MNVTVLVPDSFAARFGSAAELGRRALEALAVEEFRAERLSKAELRQLLGFETRGELDGFLKARGLFEEGTMDEVEQHRHDRDREAAARDLVARFRAFSADKTLGGLDPVELIREGRR
jgi:Arc/MetJ-type ribon-helix-helix transcriptional regulator